MFVRLRLFLVLASCPLGIQSVISTEQFVYAVSNISILPNKDVFFTEALVDASMSLQQCSLACMKNPKCFIFCHAADGTCTAGQQRTPAESELPVTNLDTSVAYECYFKTQYFDLSPQENAMLVGNLSAALNKSTTHSSKYTKFESSLVVDGDRHAVFWEAPKTCFHSADGASADFQPYMVIDMAASYLVFAFNITNRADDCIKRLHDIEVRVGFSPYNSKSNAVFQQNALCLAYNDVVDALLLFRNCLQPVVGRYISVQIVRYCPVATNKKCIPAEGNKNVLCMCELDIFALMLGS